jgi:hypothetical protein
MSLWGQHRGAYSRVATKNGFLDASPIHIDLPATSVAARAKGMSDLEERYVEI